MNTRNYLALATLKGLSSHQLAIIVKRLSKIDDLFQLTSKQQEDIGLSIRLIQALKKTDWQAIDRMQAWQQQSAHHHLITYLDTAYSAQLKEIADPPPLLFAKGDIALLNTNAVALVGSRRASQQGLDNSHEFAKALAEKNYTIISGLAQGIDTKAHLGALAANGKTIAVMGTGIDQVYPYRNRSLANAIEQSGLLLSEFPLDSKPMPFHFPRRNRIISGLSLGILVVEASLNSGSLITARLGLEQGKEVFALPSSVHNPLAKGCHHLIKQGAKLIESIEDIIEEFPPNAVNETQALKDNMIKKLESNPQTLVEFVGYEITSVHSIMALSDLPPQTVSCQLVELELKGIIKSVLGGYMRLHA